MEGSGIVSPEGVEYESTQKDEPKDKTIGGRKVTKSREEAKPGDVDELGVPWFWPSDVKQAEFANKPIPREKRKKFRNQVRGQMKARERELDSPVTRREYLALIESQIEPLFDRMKRIEFSFLALKCLLRDAGYFTEAEFVESVEKQVIKQRIEAVRAKAIDEGLDPDEVENAIKAQEAAPQFECNKCHEIKLGSGKTREIKIDAEAEKDEQVKVLKYCDVCLEIADFFCQRCRLDKKGESKEVLVKNDTFEQWCEECDLRYLTGRDSDD